MTNKNKFLKFCANVGKINIEISHLDACSDPWPKPALHWTIFSCVFLQTQWHIPNHSLWSGVEISSLAIYNVTCSPAGSLVLLRPNTADDKVLAVSENFNSILRV